MGAARGGAPNHPLVRTNSCMFTDLDRKESYAYLPRMTFTSELATEFRTSSEL